MDRRYSIKDLVDRTRPGRFYDRKIVLSFEIYERLIDNVRSTIEGKAGADVAADPTTIVAMMLLLLSNEEILTKHVYEAANAAPTDEAEWDLIRATFAWRLLGRYNRELLAALGEEEGRGDD